MKKKTVANLVMVIIICAIFAGGVLGVGYIRGWFDSAQGVALLTQRSGTVHLERNGVIYPVETDTVLRSGDRITTLPGASAVIALGEDTVTLGGDVSVSVENARLGSFSAMVHSGEVFVNCEKAVCLSFELGQVTLENATAALSVRSGAQTVSVFRGTVGGATAGQSTEYVGGEAVTRTMHLESLDDFLLSQIRACNQSMTLCYTNQDLDDLAARRQQAMEDQLNGRPENHSHSYAVTLVAPSCTEGGYTLYACACGEEYRSEETAPLSHSWGAWEVIQEATTQETGLRQRKCAGCDAAEEAIIEKLTQNHSHSYEVQVIAPACESRGYTLYICACGHSETGEIVDATGHSYEAQTVAPTCESQGYTVYTCPCGACYTDSFTQPTGHSWQSWETVREATETQEGLQQRSCAICGASQAQTLPVINPDVAGYVYIEIRCDTILDNMGNLTPGKEEFVPADGTILPMVEVAFYEGETVFEVLNRICEKMGIQIEYSWTPMYDSYYIEGINHLYEFDCGEQSGWMYKVNEWFPNYGCSSYYVEDGDVIVWCYTCNGLGADVGDDWMNEG